MTDTDTTVAQLRDAIRAFNAERDWRRFHTPRDTAMAVAVEAGELLGLYLWSADGALPVAARAPKVAEEAADVLICLANLCEAEGIDLAAAVQAKLAHNAAKYPVDLARGRMEKYSELPRDGKE